MILVALDPSSSKTGYAAFDGRALIDAGLLVPDRRAVERPQKRRSMVRDVLDLCSEHDPAEVVIEVPDGKVHWGKQAAAGTLAIYGMAVGAMVQALDTWAIDALDLRGERYKPERTIVEATVNTWTGSSPKAVRGVAAANLYGDIYDPQTDAGGDVADAIMLGLWRIDEPAMRQAIAVARMQTGRRINRRSVKGPLFGGRR